MFSSNLLADISSFGNDITTLVQRSTLDQTLLTAIRHDLRQVVESHLTSKLDTIMLRLQELVQNDKEITDTSDGAARYDTILYATPGQCVTAASSRSETLIKVSDSAEDQKTLKTRERCICAKSSHLQSRALLTGTWNLSWSNSTMFPHAKSCKYWTPRQEVWTAKLSVFYVNLLVAKALIASIIVSKQAGYFYICPSLTLRNVVKESSPAFASIKEIRDFISSYPNSLEIPYFQRRELEEIISSANRKIPRLFKERVVSPYDVDKQGRTLLHNALLCLSHSGTFLLRNSPTFRELLNTLLDAGAPINEVDVTGFTALDLLLSVANLFAPSDDTPVRPLCQLLVNRGAEMTDASFAQPNIGIFRISIELQNVASLEMWQDAAECGPLSLAILRQNEQDFLRILQSKPSSIKELNRRGQNPMHLAYCWPRGIELLLHAKASHLVHEADSYGYLPIEYSANFKCLDCTWLLLSAGSAFYYGEGPYDNVLFEFCHYSDAGVPNFIVDALREARQQLFDLAKYALPENTWADLNLPNDRLLDDRAADVQKALAEADVEIPRSLMVLQKRHTVYHNPFMPKRSADKLWHAGFRDIDTWNENGYTPLMQTKLSEYAEWLIDHGANVHLQPRFDDDSVRGFTALHSCVWSIGSEMHYYFNPQTSRKAEHDKHFLTHKKVLLNAKPHDACRCACSLNGCTPFTALLKTVDVHNRSHKDPEYRARCRRYPVQLLESANHPASPTGLPTEICEEIMRFEMFEELKLSHTCCSLKYMNAVPKYTLEQVREIHEEEEELLQKHAHLVAEFCREFREQGVTLSSFFENYWERKMAEVLADEEPLTEEEMRRLVEIGVVLEKTTNLAENNSINHEYNGEG